MTNSQINEIRGTSTVGSQNKAYVDDPLQIQQQTVVSSKGKKTKSFVFNKRLTDAPSIENYDVNGKTPSQLLALYYTLLAQSKTKLLKQLADQDPDKLGQMYLAAKGSDKADLLKDIATNTNQGTLANIYQALPNEDKGKFILGVTTASYDTLTPKQAEEVNQLIAQAFNSFISDLPQDDKAEFLKALSSTVQKLANDTQTLTEKEKAQLQQAIVNANKTVVKGDQDDKDPNDDTHFGNIMMIIVKAFNDNMNTEGLDEISQINDTKLTNMYLNVAQGVLSKNLQNQQKIVSGLDSKSKSWIFWVTLIAIAVVVVVAVVFFAPAAAADAAVGNIAADGTAVTTEATTTASDVTASAAQRATSAVEDAANGAKNTANEAEFALTKVEKAAEEVKDVVVKPVTTADEKAAVVKEAEAVAQKAQAAAADAEKAAGNAQRFSKATQKAAKFAKEAGSDAKKVDQYSQDAYVQADKANICADQAKNSAKIVADSAKKLATKYSDAVKEVKAADKAAEAAKDAAATAKDAANSESTIVRLGNKLKFGTTGWKSKVWTILQGIGVLGGASFMIEHGINPNIVPHGKDTIPLSGVNQAKTALYQTVAQFENNVINTNNNLQQTVSKRISDDSEKIQQASGFVQQAINMFGQAMQFRA